MLRPELDNLLATMLASQPEVPDLLFTVDKPPQVESFGELKTVTLNVPIEKLTPYQTEMIALNLIGENQWLVADLLKLAGNNAHRAERENQWLVADLLKHGLCDGSYSLADQARFRVNVFAQRGNYSIVCRKLNTTIPTLEGLQFPEIFSRLPLEKTGLGLVTGTTGSGKTTTLAAVLNEVNRHRAVHVVTLEDPVEYVHPQLKATFNQRELGQDFDTFSNGGRAALRQAPKVILVGEMRDRDTVNIALSAAETGHLVLSTLHTIDAGQTINRILGLFDAEEQEQVRLRLADTLRWGISQRLVPRVGGGRNAVLEIMGANLRTQESIRLGESEGKTFHEIIEASHTFGWRTFDHSCLEADDHGKITEETALLYCSRHGPVTRGIDHIKKSRGESTTDLSGLRMRVRAGSAGEPPPVPLTLKIR